MKRLVAMPQVLWFLLASTLAISHLAVATPVPSPMLGSHHCPSKCGDVEVPYPFGIGADCARPGLDIDNFRVYCNDSSKPPRLYTRNLEIISISLDTGEVRLYAPVAYNCYTSSNTIESGRSIHWSVYDPYLISTARNVFTVIGCNTLAVVQGGRSYFTGCITSCASLKQAARDGEECTGLGCCQTLISRNLSTIQVAWNNGTISNPAWSYSPCSYAMLVEKGRYNFSRRDLVRTNKNDSFASWVKQEKIPMVLDWAIRGNGSCRPPAAKDAGPSAKWTAPDCVSEQSICVNATQGPGYLCNCSEGYRGNPYIIGGCKNINECQEYANLCHSTSTCHDTPGGYNCKCKFGLKGDGKIDNGCQPIFPPWALAIIAAFAFVVVACLVIVDVKRRKQRRFFDKNGGDILKSMGINIFTEQQLKKMTNSYKETIGEGAFGKVYIGTIDEGTQRVAVKRAASVKGASLPQEEFVNEITIQFRISHANLVRLVGCCLETDVPMLVFEFISKGSLFKVLHGADDDQEALRLLERVDIAIGSAEALAYMHSHGDGGQNHVHGDVKSGNILLSDDLTPKVSDFGSSKLVSVASMYSKWCVAGDMSYIDPVYIKSGRFTEKSDVYSFGVVLLELITRKKAKYGDNSLPLDFVKCCKEEGNGRKLYDRDILPDDDAQAHRHMECLDRIGALAVRCLKEDVDERPTMAEVLDELKQVKAIASGVSSGSVAS